MQLTYHRIDVEQTRAQGRPLGDIVERGSPGEIWQVPFSPLDLQSEPKWRHYRRERSVYIPMFPYLVSPNPADALGFAFQLGVRAIHDLGGQPAKRLHLAIGDPVQQVRDDNTGEVFWSFNFGFGIVL